MDELGVLSTARADTEDEMPLWANEHQRAVADRLICRLLGRRLPAGLELCTETRADELALVAISNGLDRSFVANAILAIEGAPAKVPSAFETVYSELRRKHARDRALGSREWAFVIPLYCKFEDAKRTEANIRVLGVDFAIARFDQLQSLTTDAALAKAAATASQQHDAPLSELCLIVREMDQEPSWAFDRIEAAYDTLRGLVQYLAAQGASGWFWPEQPRRAIEWARWFLAVRPGTELIDDMFFVGAPRVRSRRFVLKDALFTALESTGPAEPPKKGSTRELVASALRLYAQAFDLDRNYGCFTGLWQMAEAMTLAAPRGDTDTVCQRLSFFVACSNSPRILEPRSILRALAEKRNKVVHEGRHTMIEEDDVNLLKFFCDMAIDWLVVQSTALPSVGDLRQFFDAMLQSEADFEHAVIARTAAKRMRELLGDRWPVAPPVKR